MTTNHKPTHNPADPNLPQALPPGAGGKCVLSSGEDAFDLHITNPPADLMWALYARSGVKQVLLRMEDDLRTTLGLTEAWQMVDAAIAPLLECYRTGRASVARSGIFNGLKTGGSLIETRPYLHELSSDPRTTHYLANALAGEIFVVGVATIRACQPRTVLELRRLVHNHFAPAVVHLQREVNAAYVQLVDMYPILKGRKTVLETVGAGDEPRTLRVISVAEPQA